MLTQKKITKLLYMAELAYQADNLNRCNRLEKYVVKYEQLAKHLPK